MKLTKRTIIYISGIALLTTSIVACNHGTPEERGEKIVEKVTKELELNATQKAKLSEVKDEFLESRKTMRSNRDETKAEVLTMLEQPTFDRNKANSIVNQHVETIQSRSPVIIEAIGNFYDSLDDTQRAELREFIADKMDKRHSRHF